MDIAAIPDKVAIVAPLSSPPPWPARSTSATRRAGRPRERDSGCLTALARAPAALFELVGIR